MEGHRAFAPGLVLGLAALQACAGGVPPPAIPLAAPDCSDGVVKDDGSVDSGYGFVPSATEGIYLQKFDGADFDHPLLATVCICWLKTRGEGDIEFEIVIYPDEGGRPANQPATSFPATATEVAASKEEAGKFVSVETGGWEIPQGSFYIGARWDPSRNQFLFMCNDHSEATEKADVFFREDRSPGWTLVYDSRDPIFIPHRSVMVRATSAPRPPVPSGPLKPASAQP